MSGFVLHPSAISDIEEIWAFIAEDSPDAADRVIEEIYEAIRGLVSFPDSGHTRSDLIAAATLLDGKRFFDRLRGR